MGVMDDIRDAARRAVYLAILPNLLVFKPKPSQSFSPRGGVATDEIILHGTESLATEEQSANYVASAATSSHYFIGRTQGVAYSIVSEEVQAFHAGNPKGHATVQDHNARSIGIEMYQRGHPDLRRERLEARLHGLAVRDDRDAGLRHPPTPRHQQCERQGPCRRQQRRPCRSKEFRLAPPPATGVGPVPDPGPTARRRLPYQSRMAEPANSSALTSMGHHRLTPGLPVNGPPEATDEGWAEHLNQRGTTP